jgi:hypothetical protein
VTSSEPAGHRPLGQRFSQASPALTFVLTAGIMSFSADFTYQGSRSFGPCLGTLVVGALGIAVITGAGEAFAIVAQFTAIPLIPRVRRHSSAKKGTP